MEHTAELLVRDLVTVHPGQSVRDVARLMKAKHVGCVIVTEGGKVAGIFSERDLVNRVVAGDLDPDSTHVSQVMTREPVVVDVRKPLEDVFAVLARRRFRHVPIVDGERPVGMVSLSDFAAVLREVFGEPRYLQYFVDYCKAGRR